MGLFDFLFGKNYIVTDAAELKTRLLDAANAGDRRTLKKLCETNLDLVRQNMKAWSKIPEAERTPDRIPYYGNGLIAILTCIERDLRRSDLIPELIGTPDTNPYMRCQNKIQHAKELLNELKLADAIVEINDALIDSKGFQGDQATLDRAVSLGLLGQCHLHLGAAEKAFEPLKQAINLCRQLNDHEGTRIYLSNLYEAHRYHGQGDLAANAAEELASVLEHTGNLSDARRYRKVAQIARAGEPLNRIVLVIGDERKEVDEVTAFPTGKTNFEFTRNRIELAPATKSCKAGGELGAKNKYEDALACFRDAAKADVHAPHAHYEAGWTLALLQRYNQAIESYENAERLAPGWFFVRSDLWFAQQISLGNISHEVYVATRRLEDYPDKSFLDGVEKLLARHNQIARLHLIHGKILNGCNRAKDAESSYRRGLECDGDKDTRCCLMLSLAISPGIDAAEKDRLLKQIIELDGNLNASATARIFLRAK